MVQVIERAEIKEHEELLVLKSFLLSTHYIPEHTRKILEENKHREKNFCEESRHFAVTGPLYLYYDITTWYDYQENKYSLRLERIGLYDDFMEYNIDRLKGIHSTTNSSGGNLN